MNIFFNSILLPLDPGAEDVNMAKSYILMLNKQRDFFFLLQFLLGLVPSLVCVGIDYRGEGRGGGRYRTIFFILTFGFLLVLAS